MKGHISVPLLAALLLIVISGCTNAGAFISSNQTIVNLNDGNYTVSATNVTGTSRAGYILGASFPGGVVTHTVALARISGTAQLYADAIEDLWNNYEEEYGDAADRSLALANIQFDSDIVNLILYSQVQVTIRADVVEFGQ